MDTTGPENTQHFYVNPKLLDLIKPGETTERELYQILGRKVRKRQTFSPIFPYQYRKKNVPIDRFITYEAGKGVVQRTPESTSTTIYEVLLVKFFTYKGVVQFYSVIHYDKDTDVVTTESTVDALETNIEEIAKKSNMSIWGFERCTSKFYEIKMLHYDKKPTHWINAEDETCYWEEPDFEKKLLENKEYQDFLNDPHYGKKLLEMGYIPPAAKWKGK
jgi:hypothetical protein